MNLGGARVVLRPRGPGECVDLALCLLRADAGDHLRLFLWVGLPASVVLAGASFAGPTAAWVAVWLLRGVIEAPFTLLAGQRIFRQGYGLKDALRLGLSSQFAIQLPRLLWWLTLVGAAYTMQEHSPGLVLLAFLGTLPLVPRFLFLPEAVLLEREHATTGGPARRAAALNRVRRGRAAVALVWCLGIEAYGLLAGEALGKAVVADLLQLGQPFGAAWPDGITPYGLAGILAVQPIRALVRLSFYLDQRIHAEGWDIRVGLQALLGWGS